MMMMTAEIHVIDCMHFGVIMDPKAGEVVWAEGYPISGDWSEDEGGAVPVDRWSI